MQKQKIENIIKTEEYKSLLKKLTKDIYSGCKKAVNEAEVVSVFEIELFSFINQTFDLKFYPQKEVTVNSIRLSKKGRIDSKISALILEFKHKSKLIGKSNQTKAVKQIKKYLDTLDNKDNYEGVITDGQNIKFIYSTNDKFFETPFHKIETNDLDLIIKNIVLLEKTALTPENLTKDFCEPDDESLVNDLLNDLFKTIKENPTDKTKMLFKEWMELFRLAHDDTSKQLAIEQRKKSLSKLIKSGINDNLDEYLVLFSLQTTYAIIIKIIAYKVISKIKFNESLIDFEELSNSKSSVIQMQLNSIEEGAIFRDLGIGNLLEGDFFSWYSNKSQWNETISNTIRKIFIKLTKYEDKALFETKNTTYDLFKDLYLKIIPDKVRHSLGEFYTPSWLAENVVSEGITLSKNNNWVGLDPCAGSGTFVTVMIKKVLDQTQTLKPEGKLKNILNRVKGIDLNPLAVLTTRINYFINIAHLIPNELKFEIPIYLGDSSYVPESTIVDKVECLKYTINTLKGNIDIIFPKSAVKDNILFSKTMTEIEDDIKNLDEKNVIKKLLFLIPNNDRTKKIIEHIKELATRFVQLEKNGWNGIWARIITNFLTTANLGKFDLIASNPPWIDWKNLPEGYRERIKSLCIDRMLFSGDGITGGINLNICALISNVSAENWLKRKGILAFLMPQTILFQQSYDGFRKLRLKDKEKLYFIKLDDWTSSGHPFQPVQQKFLSYYFSRNKTDYKKGINLTKYNKKKNYKLSDFSKMQSFKNVEHIFDKEIKLVGQTSEKNTSFSYANSKNELTMFKLISGESFYIGREGIEFYPQELFLLEPNLKLPQSKNNFYLNNYQNEKSKYKIPKETIVLEKSFLFPLIKGINIKRFSINKLQYLVPFPYSNDNYRSPLPLKSLQSKAPLLANHLKKFRSIMESQTNYNEKIIGKKHSSEFYSLARVGKYSFQKNYVAFRDNTKWQAAVVPEIKTPWGEKKRPLFQNHAVSICEDKNGNFINLDEANYICAILNSPIVYNFMMNSSDSRSFKIRPPIYIPKYNAKNKLHVRLSEISKIYHSRVMNEIKASKFDIEIDEIYKKICLTKKTRN